MVKPSQATFEALGHDAETAEYYAGRPDAERYVARSAFLHLLSRLMIQPEQRVEATGELAWIESWLRAARRKQEPPTGVAASVQRLLDAGIDPLDLSHVVHAMQREVIDNALMLLDGSTRSLTGVPDLPPAAWRLFRVTTDPRAPLTPLEAMESLHEQLNEVTGD